MQQVMVSCYNIQFATADWIKRVKETVLESAVTKMT